MIYPRTKVLERRREVTSMLVRGVSPGEIAEILDVPRQTVYNDIRAVRSGRNEALIAHTRREITAQLYLNAQERARSLWRIADTAQSDYVRVLALKELRLQDQCIVRKLLPVEYLTKEQEKMPPWERGLLLSREMRKCFPPSPGKEEKKEPAVLPEDSPAGDAAD